MFAVFPSPVISPSFFPYSPPSLPLSSSLSSTIHLFYPLSPFSPLFLVTVLAVLGCVGSKPDKVMKRDNNKQEQQARRSGREGRTSERREVERGVRLANILNLGRSANQHLAQTVVARVIAATKQRITVHISHEDDNLAEAKPIDWHGDCLGSTAKSCSRRGSFDE